MEDFATDVVENEHIREHNETSLAGYYGWYLYGFLVIANFSYYADLYHTKYKKSIYHSPTGVAFKTIYGLGTWLRSVWKLTVWGITGIFWVLTFIPLRVFKQIFYYIVFGVMGAELVRIIGIIIIDCAALIGDDYSVNHELKSDQMSKIIARGDLMEVSEEKETDYSWIDYLIEMSTISQMSIAFPLYF